MEMPRPGEAHRKLERLVGVWSGEETMFPSEWDPAGGTAEATSRARRALDGFAVLVDYEQRRAGQVTFSGHGVWTADAKSGEVVLYWFDSLGLGLETFRGGWEGDVLAVRSRNPMGHARLVYDLAEPGRMLNRMETSRDGEEWKPMFEGVYRRGGASEGE